MRAFTVGYVPIRSARGLRARCDYIQDEHRRSHSQHRVLDFAVHGPFRNVIDWIERMAAAEEIVRRVVSAGRDLARVGTMYCVRFVAGTFLSDDERRRIADALHPALHLDHGGCSAWHVHKFDGEADLHAVIAHVEWDSIPLIRPRSSIPHLPILRKTVVTAFSEITAMRLELGASTPRHSPAPESSVLPAKLSPDIEEVAEALGPNSRRKRKANPKFHVTSQDPAPLL